MITNKSKIKDSMKHKYPPRKFVPVKTGHVVKDMKSGICIPSAVHGYSLAVEYYRDWFLSRFEDRNYFKTVFINGRHIIQDYMRYSSLSLIKRDKPAVAITPVANLEHDRDLQDSYMGGKDMLIGKFNHQQGFFKDYERNIFIGMGVRELEVQFAVRTRVESKAQQQDLYREMEIACRVGYSQYEYISADFHIPLEIIKNVALGAGFKLNEKEEVEDVYEFVKYLNAHSEFPVLYKLRTITGNSEYFIRVNKVYAHIYTPDKLDADDGEKEGMLDNDFHIDMSSTLHIWVPSYFVITSATPIYKYLPVKDSNIFGLYTTQILEFPDIDEHGWNLYIKTNYEIDIDIYKSQQCTIDISGLLHNSNLKKVIISHLEMGLSPSRFIHIKIFDSNRFIKYNIEWGKLLIHIKDFESQVLYIGVYIDTLYYNESKETIYNINKNRYNKEEK